MFLKEEVKKIKKDIYEKGFYHCQVSNIESFFELSNQLGTIKQCTNVRLDSSKDEFPYISGEVDFHTDNPTIEILGWFIHIQDEYDGKILLINVEDILSKMTKIDIEYLTNINIKMPSRKNDYYPFLTKGKKSHIFYIPPHCWKENPNYSDEEEQEAVMIFHNLVLDKKKNKQYHSINLKEGEVLFLNNYFMIHGRDKISKNSKRFLERVFISPNSEKFS